MSVIIRIPNSLKEWFKKKDEVLCRGDTVGACFTSLEETYPGIRDRLIDEKGDLSAVLVFLNGDNIRSLEGLSTAVADGDEISIIPLAAGG